MVSLSHEKTSGLLMTNSISKTVCFFNSNKAWGGGEKWHLTTCKEFQRRGFNTILVTNDDSEIGKRGVTEKLNVYRFRIGNLSFLNPFKILTFFLFFKTKGVDAVVMNLPSDLKVAGIAAKLAGVKKIIYRRGMPHPLRNTWLNRFLFSRVLTHVVVNSKEIGRSLKQGNEEWFPEEKMVLIYNGVDTSRPVDKSRKLYQKQGDEIVIGNAGRLTEQKGQKYLIELAKLMKADGKNFKILIAGEGELHQALQKIIDDEGLKDQVKLLGHVSDMPAFFTSLDVFVFTSLYEGSANTLIETLQYGVPTIAWDISSNPEIIKNQKTGYLVKLADVQELATKIYMTMKDESLKKEFILNGEKEVFDNFDSIKNLKILFQII
jgi:glycosyltransferase involved in cell wall biosynthesis